MQQLQQLIEKKSLHIQKGMKAYWSNTDKVQELNPKAYVKRLTGKVFAVAGYRVVGYMIKGEMYITPYTKETIQILRNNGFKEYSFFVPLSPPEMSLVDQELSRTWQKLVNEANRSSNLVAVATA